MNGNRITDVRKERGVTLEELADRVGLSVSYVQRMEKAKRNLSLKNLTKIARALDVSPSELIEVRGKDQRIIDALRKANEAQRAAVSLILGIGDPSGAPPKQPASPSEEPRAKPK